MQTKRPQRTNFDVQHLTLCVLLVLPNPNYVFFCSFSACSPSVCVYPAPKTPPFFSTSSSLSSHTDNADGPRPRLCILHTWPDFQGFGFNLHAEKGKPGQFIGKVDPNSPSDAAGMRQGDRIVEVNDVSVLDESHAQVVNRIKQIPNTVRMLVIEPDGERYYKEKGITITGNMSNVIVGEAKPRSAAAVHVSSNEGKK